MPVHDWSRVEAGIFHDFHHAWIEEIKRALNRILPAEYYAMSEQHAAGFGPDVLTLQWALPQTSPGRQPQLPPGNGGGVSLAPPPVELTAEGETEFYHLKQKSVVVRHVGGDSLIAVVEVVSPGNKGTQHGLDSFVRKACELFDRDIHLLVLDLHPPTPRDPSGIHAEIWDEYIGEAYEVPRDRPITLAAYERDLALRAYVQHRAIGEPLPAMPLFVRPRAHVLVPLEETYNSAFDAVPRRWQCVLE
jgi:hypothetical protein